MDQFFYPLNWTHLNCKKSNRLKKNRLSTVSDQAIWDWDLNLIPSKLQSFLKSKKSQVPKQSPWNLFVHLCPIFLGETALQNSPNSNRNKGHLVIWVPGHGLIFQQSNWKITNFLNYKLNTTSESLPISMGVHLPEKMFALFSLRPSS